MGGIEVVSRMEPSVKDIAGLFWELSAKQQADFFAELDAMAGVKLCFQMAWVISEIRERADRGDYSAMNGLRTMLSHADGYAEAALDMRANDAKRAINNLARGEA